MERDTIMQIISRILKKYYMRGFIIGVDKTRKLYEPEMTIMESTEFIEELRKKFEKEYDEKL